MSGWQPLAMGGGLKRLCFRFMATMASWRTRNELATVVASGVQYAGARPSGKVGAHAEVLRALEQEQLKHVPRHRPPASDAAV